MNGARKTAWLLARVALTVALLALILRKVSPGEIAGALAGAAVWPLVAGLALGAGFTAVKAFRWGWLLRRLGIACAPNEALRSYLGGMAVGLTTPGRVGEVARSLYLAAPDRAYVSGAALVDKVLDVTVIVTAGAAGCAAQRFFTAAALLALFAVALVTGIFLPARALRAAARAVPFAPARRLAERLVRPAAEVRHGTRALALLQAAGAFVLAAVQFHLFLSAFVAAPARATVFVMPLLVLSNLIPVTLSGVGVREWASVILFSTYSVPGAIAVNVALLVFFSNSLVPGLAGTALAPRWRVPAASAEHGAVGEAAR